MAYLQITTVCNMSCAHCCMSCGKNYKGQHMDEYTFQKSLDFLKEYSEYITLGGGEPTLHPKFQDFLIRSIAYTQMYNIDLAPLIITNGSKTDISLWMLYNMNGHERDFWDIAQNYGIIYQEGNYFDVELSQDRHHDKSIVDDRVIDAFTHFNQIRNVDGNEIKTGHWRGNYGRENVCTCPTWQIKPDGKIFLCGCDNSPCIGDIFRGLDWEIQETDFDGCWNTPECEKAVEAHRHYEGKMTNDDWVNQNITVKPKYINHPETYRLSL